MYPSTICTAPYQVCTRLWTVRSFLVIYGSMTIQVLAYGFLHPNRASARAVFMMFSLFFCFCRPSFSPAIRLASPFPRAIIFDRPFGGETTLYLRLERDWRVWAAGADAVGPCNILPASRVRRQRGAPRVDRGSLGGVWIGTSRTPAPAPPAAHALQR